jgi:hypothetical protein
MSEQILESKENGIPKIVSASFPTLIKLLFILLCVSGIGLLQFPRLQTVLRTNQTVTKETLEKDVQAEQARLKLLKKIPGFGYDNIISNWTYLSFLQYFGDDEARVKTGFHISPDYFEIILTKDPRFLTAYFSLSSSTSLFAGKPERSIKIIEQGLKSVNPWVPERSYYIWRYKGTDELLFLGDSQAAKKSFAKAADWASNHSDEESKAVASISQQTANFLAQNPDSKYAQISTWAMVLNNRVDEKTQKRAIDAIKALGGEVISTPKGNQIKFPPKD